MGGGQQGGVGWLLAMLSTMQQLFILGQATCHAWLRLAHPDNHTTETGAALARLMRQRPHR